MKHKRKLGSSRNCQEGQRTSRRSHARDSGPNHKSWDAYTVPLTSTGHCHWCHSTCTLGFVLWASARIQRYSGPFRIQIQYFEFRSQRIQVMSSLPHPHLIPSWIKVQVGAWIGRVQQTGSCCGHKKQIQMLHCTVVLFPPGIIMWGFPNPRKGFKAREVRNNGKHLPHKVFRILMNSLR